jgi:serine/threonine-protein kinase RsbW
MSEPEPTAPAGVAEFCIPSEWAEVRRVQREVESALAAAGYADRDQFYIKVAMEEALANAVKHGNRLDAAKLVRVRLVFAPGRFEARVADEGTGFDPNAVPDPCAPENLERPCGRGLLLIRKFMTTVVYHGRGNCLSMARDCPPG